MDFFCVNKAHDYFLNVSEKVISSIIELEHFPDYISNLFYELVFLVQQLLSTKHLQKATDEMAEMQGSSGLPQICAERPLLVSFSKLLTCSLLPSL